MADDRHRQQCDCNCYAHSCSSAVRQTDDVNSKLSFENVSHRNSERRAEKRSAFRRPPVSPYCLTVTQTDELAAACPAGARTRPSTSTAEWLEHAAGDRRSAVRPERRKALRFS